MEEIFLPSTLLYTGQSLYSLTKWLKKANEWQHLKLPVIISDTGSASLQWQSHRVVTLTGSEFIENWKSKCDLHNQYEGISGALKHLNSQSTV